MKYSMQLMLAPLLFPLPPLRSGYIVAGPRFPREHPNAKEAFCYSAKLQTLHENEENWAEGGSKICLCRSATPPQSFIQHYSR